MFPNPQAALPLPPKPNVERYKKLAKELVKACKSDDPDAIRNWTEKWVTNVVKLSGLVITRHLPVRVNSWVKDINGFVRRHLSSANKNSSSTETKTEPRRCRLADAQFIIARSHGFLSWPKFLKHIDGLSRKTSDIAHFEAATEAIVSGDFKTLKKLLERDPNLVHMRSTREHRATLLHYVSANGVEGYRQKTPKNVVKITKLLLETGAEVDAEADVYGGGATALGLVGTSVHPYLAGVQNPLMQILLDHGAEIDHRTSGGNQQRAVIACMSNGRGEAAEYLAEHGAKLDLESAAAVGKLEVVKKFFEQDGKLKSNATIQQLEAGFRFACGWRRTDVVEFLLQMGVDLRAHDRQGQTALHWAVMGAHVDIVKLLLKHKPPLDIRNVYGGTPLGQAAWCAAHDGDTERYAAIIETLIKAGTKVPERHVPINKRIDDLLRRYGSEPEPSWHWTEEELY